MYAEAVIVSILVLSVTIARFIKDVLIVQLISTLTRDNTLTKMQRFEICTRLAASLGAGSDLPTNSSPGPMNAHCYPATTTHGSGSSADVVSPALSVDMTVRSSAVRLSRDVLSGHPERVGRRSR